MKRSITLKTVLAFFLATLFTAAVAQDLPSPAANLKTMPAGSYVIAMDNTNQAGSNGYFNLKAYGLVVNLLNNNVKVKWVIKSGKAKDATDVKVNAFRIKPSAAAAADFDFKSGPFAVYAADTAGVAALVDAYNSSLTTASDKIKIYKTTAAVTVDERYNLAGFKPKALLLNNGGNYKIHRANMLLAGIDGGINSTETQATNWVVGVASDLSNGCYTFASEAHWDEKTPAKAQPVIDQIRSFLVSGGNVLAQCAAVRTYENTGLFLSTGGINSSVENKFTGSLTSITYPNADLSYSQIQGPLQIDKGGSLQNWQYAGTTRNGEHSHAKGSAQIGAAAAKFRGAGQGGMLFYLGNHSFDKTDKVEVLNGIRMYLNAFLTPPANLAPVCSAPPTPLLNSNLGGRLWMDINHNNTFDDYEPGAPNVLVRLYLDANGDNQPDSDEAIDSIYTSATGMYGFSNLADGKYIIGVVIDTNKYSLMNMTPTTGLYPDNNILRDNNGVTLVNRNEIRSMSITLKAGSMPTDDGDGANGNLTLSVALLGKSNSVLPVTVMQFGGNSNGNKAQLSWKVANEASLKSYVVEKSTDGRSFTEIGTVSSLNTSAVKEYSFTDVNTAGSAILYYRLRYVSNDDRYTLSNIVSIRFGSGKNAMTVYPNPATSYVVMNIQSAEATTGTARILSATGQVVLSRPLTVVKGSNAITFSNLGSLGNGVYHLSVRMDNGDAFDQPLLLNR